MQAFLKVLLVLICSTLGVVLAVMIATTSDSGLNSFLSDFSFDTNFPLSQQSYPQVSITTNEHSVQSINTSSESLQKQEVNSQLLKMQSELNHSIRSQNHQIHQLTQSTSDLVKKMDDKLQVQNATALMPYKPAYNQQFDTSRIEQTIKNAQANQEKPWEVVSKAIDSIKEVAEQGIQAQSNQKAIVEASPTVSTPTNQPYHESLPSSDPAVSSILTSKQPRAEVFPGEGDDSLSIMIQDTDIREVLEMISEQGKLNILPSPQVQGNVSATLSKVDMRAALFAILRSSGYDYEEVGGFIYVGTPEDILAMRNASDKISTKIYRPSYVRAADLQILLTPLLSPGIGTISVSAPATTGIAANSDDAGGDEFAGEEVVIIRDYSSNLMRIENALLEIDKRPLQVAIEATIMSVQMDDDLEIGVSFEALVDRNTVRLTSGFPPTDLSSLDINGGLKFGFLDASLAMLIEALETVGDTNIIASPQLLVLNKQRAEILIGEQKGYLSTTVTENAATQAVEFLELGTQLRIRPFIGSDGFIRLEVHPEISTGDVDTESGFTLPNKEVTQVTTNVICPDGRTVIIGGLINSQEQSDITQIPFLGSLPGIGTIFRQKQEKLIREELIILITPRIVDPAHISEDGEKSRDLFELHHSHFADKMSPLGKRYIGRKYYRLATSAWATGDGISALRYCNLSIHYDPQNLEAVHLREVVIRNTGLGDRSVKTHLREGLAPWEHPHGVEVSPWHVDQIQPVYPEELIMPGSRIPYEGQLPPAVESMPEANIQHLEPNAPLIQIP